MSASQSLQSFEIIKLLGDPRRLAILRYLMAQAATLSQLGRYLDLHPAKIRYHLVQLEAAGLVDLVSTQDIGGFVEKYYRASAQAYFINLAVLPEPAGAGQIVLIGSHDPALELLAAALVVDDRTPGMRVVSVGSLDGLLALRQGFCQLTGCHLYDPLLGEYNIPYVRHFFPGQAMQMVTLAHRQQGLMLAPGNPKGIRGLEDLGRSDLNFVNRQVGSGTRLWLDQQLQMLGLEPTQISGYDSAANTHQQVAATVQQGQADLGLGVLAAARMAGLDFIPLFEERYDLVIADQTYHSPRLLPALEYLHSAQFRATLQALGGYRLQETGNEIHIT